MNELTGWVQGHKKAMEQKHEKETKKRNRKQYPAPRRLKAALRNQLDMNYQPSDRYSSLL